jgi:hypothetical protein
MGTIILYHDKENKEVSILNNTTWFVEAKWTNCSLMLDIVDETTYQILDVGSNYSDILARFPANVVSVFYTLPKKTYTIDDINWNDGVGY